MGKVLYYIRGGRMHMLEGGTCRELPDGIYDGYVRRKEANAKRKEWKQTGDGAAFLGAAEQTPPPSSVRAAVSSVCRHDGVIYYSEQIDEISGIYRKNSADDTLERVGISGNDCVYLGLDIHSDKMAASIATLTQAHIGVCTLPSFDIEMVTEGYSYDTDPCFSLVRPDTVYFSSAGLAHSEQDGEELPRRGHLTPEQYMRMIGESAAPIERGPSAICRIDLRTGKLETLLEDDSFDFCKPRCTADGSLYYIKKPYRQEKEQGTFFGCLGDIVMLPFRLLRALFGFFNIFSMKYSGKTLSNNATKAKSKDQGEMMIDGNLINAEKELKNNRTDKNPGIIPRSYELRKIDRSGQDTLVRRGVLCYTLDGEDVICSNGRHILRINGAGEEQVLAHEDCVTFLYLADEE